MKRKSLVIVVLFLTAVLSSCGRHIPIEDLTISLILGVDLDDENNLIISESSPVFNKSAKKSNATFQLKAKSIRESRKYFDALMAGEVTSAKIQVLLIGKRVLEHEGWFSILDTVFRNPNFSINTRVMMVDGPVADVIFYEPLDKPQLALHLQEVIDKNNARSRTVNSTLQVLHRQMYEKGITPSISEVKKKKAVEFVGVSLLDDKGKYVDTLSIEEASLLLVLKNEQKQELTLTIPMTAVEEKGGILHKNELSMDINRVKTKIKTQYKQDQFQFTYKIQMSVNIVEQLFPVNRVKQNELEQMIAKKLESRLEDLIRKIQKKNIDPIGLGLYARAYHYEQYKKVEDRWAEAFVESKINVSVDVDINTMGATK
jgi:Ger(x)C family germination protein